MNEGTSTQTPLVDDNSERFYICCFRLGGIRRACAFQIATVMSSKPAAARKSSKICRMQYTPHIPTTGDDKLGSEAQIAILKQAAVKNNANSRRAQLV